VGAAMFTAFETKRAGQVSRSLLLLSRSLLLLSRSLLAL
jgi:hypothetical protein